MGRRGGSVARASDSRSEGPEVRTLSGAQDKFVRVFLIFFFGADSVGVPNPRVYTHA